MTKLPCGSTYCFLTEVDHGTICSTTAVQYQPLFLVVPSFGTGFITDPGLRATDTERDITRSLAKTANNVVRSSQSYWEFHG